MDSTPVSRFLNSPAGKFCDYVPIVSSFTTLAGIFANVHQEKEQKKSIFRRTLDQAPDSFPKKYCGENPAGCVALFRQRHSWDT